MGRDPVRFHAQSHPFSPVPETATIQPPVRFHSESETALHTWIESTRPSPFAILRKIAELSPDHRSVLLLLATELEQTMEVICPAPPPAPLVAEAAPDDAERITIESEIRALSEREQKLRQTIQELGREKEELTSAVARIKRTLEKQTFDRHRRASAQKSERDMAQARKTLEKNKRRASARYNELWGERKQLKDALAKVNNELDEERHFQAHFAEVRANAQLPPRAEDDAAPRSIV
jgi:septal ring factor EnvC (AmiA/AmiB activator)